MVGKSRKGESSTEFQNCENYNNHGEKKGKIRGLIWARKNEGFGFEISIGERVVMMERDDLEQGCHDSSSSFLFLFSYLFSLSFLFYFSI